MESAFKQLMTMLFLRVFICFLRTLVRSTYTVSSFRGGQYALNFINCIANWHFSIV